MTVANERSMSSPSTTEALPYDRIQLAIFIVSFVTIITFVIRFVRYRQEYGKIHGSLASPPFNFVFGNLPAFIDLFKGVPADAHPHGPLTLLHRKLHLSGLYYLDAWPASPERQMIIADPGVAAQVAQIRVLPKHQTIKGATRHVCGPTSMLFTEGAMWKRARTMFNSGFALGHLMTQLPAIAKDAVVFSQILARYADSGEVFQIEPAAKKLAIDVMGRVVLDLSLSSQTENNELVEAFIAAVNVTPDISNPYALSHLNPFLYYKRWYYEQVMDTYLGKALDERLKFRETSSDAPLSGKRGRKPIIDLAIDEYYAQQEAEATSGKEKGSVEQLKRFSIDQMKTFLLAGHDTTSSALAYIYYLLGHHPAAVAKLRNEYDEVFGPDSALTESRMRQDPHLINKLEYTTAVIKETLRLYPPATAVRQGDGSSLLYEGKSYPTGNGLVWLQNHTLHRRADLYPSPDEFIPERFLPAPNNSQEVVKDSWRPFEKGPRACLGQELAMLEIKIVMALTVREFDIQDAYEEWDRKLGRKNPGDDLDGKRGMFGYRSYQILQLTAKPVDGMPVRVKRRSA